MVNEMFLANHQAMPMRLQEKSQGKTNLQENLMKDHIKDRPNHEKQSKEKRREITCNKIIIIMTD